jgi:hypothetical protein
MKIEFNKTIKGEDSLGTFVKKTEPTYRYTYTNKHIGYNVGFEYNSVGLSKHLIDIVEAEFSKNKYTFIRSAYNELWISAPDRFSLVICEAEEEDPDNDEYTPQKMIVSNNEVRDVVIAKKRFIGKKELPVYSFIPSVEITGAVQYDILTAVEPTPVIQMLVSLGYETHVVAPTDLPELLETMKEKMAELQIQLDKISELTQKCKTGTNTE